MILNPVSPNRSSLKIHHLDCGVSLVNTDIVHLSHMQITNSKDKSDTLSSFNSALLSDSLKYARNVGTKVHFLELTQPADGIRQSNEKRKQAH